MAVAFWMKDFYEPAARIEADPVGSGMKALGEIQWNTDENDENYVDTQTQLLQDDSIAIAVIRALHLDQNPEFVGKGAIERYSRQPAAVRQTKSQPSVAYGDLQEDLNLANRTPLESAALATFHKNLAVNTIHNTRVIEVTFKCHDAQLAQDILNTLVTQYLDQNFRMRHTTTMQASEWLGAQVDELRHRMEEANQAVTNYERQNDLVEFDDRDVPTGQLMYEVNHELSQAEANRIEQESYVRMIEEGSGDAVPAVRDDQLYQTLMARYGDVREQLARARTIYGDENSTVKKLEGESSELSKQVEAERKRMINQVKTSYAASLQAEHMLLASRQKLRAEMGDSSSKMTQLRLLRGQAVASAELYNTLKSRLVEARIYAGLRSSNIHVVDFAPKLPAPSGPHRALIVATGLVVNCMIAVVLSFVKESFNNKVRTPDDLRIWAGLPSLAMLPRMNGHSSGANGNRTSLPGFSGFAETESGVQFVQRDTAEAEAMCDLRTALMLSANGAVPRVILVTSALRSEGKTTVAANLAMVFAQCGTTCLVDGDLRRPAVAKSFDIGTKPGLQTVLSGPASVDEALESVTSVPNLFALVTTAPPANNPIDLLASDRMRSLIAELRNRFRFVVIDSPAVIPYSDARILSSYADVVIVVGRYELTTRRALTRCTQLLEEVNAPVAGAIVNAIDLSSPDFHYYNYGYGGLRSGTSFLRREIEVSTPVAPPPEDSPKAKSAGV